MAIRIDTPITEEMAKSLKVGDTIEIYGTILCGRDAVLPKVVKLIEDNGLEAKGIDLTGGVVFHTAVSPAATS